MTFEKALEVKRIEYIGEAREPDGTVDRRKFVGRCKVCGHVQKFDKYGIGDTLTPCENCRAVRNLERGQEREGWRILTVKLIKGTYFVVLRCLKCGNMITVNAMQAKDADFKIPCSGCRKIEEARRLKQEKLAEQRRFTKTDIREAAANDDRESLFKMGKIVDVVVSDISDDKLTVVKKNIAAFAPNKDISVVVNGLKVTHLIRGEKNRLVCNCEKCKSNVILTRNAVMVTKNATCPICEFMSKRASKIENANVEKVIGQYFYGLKILAIDDNLNATVRCKYHNKKKLEFQVPLAAIKLHTAQAVCPHCVKERTSVKITCPVCGTLVGAPLAVTFGNDPSKMYRCSRCGCQFTQGDFINNSDKNLEYYDKISKYTNKGMAYRGINRDTGVAQFCVAFVGRDGIPRYNCYCAEHRQELVLTQEEYENYGNHKYCDKEASKFIKMVPTHRAVKNDAREKSLLDDLKD